MVAVPNACAHACFHGLALVHAQFWAKAGSALTGLLLSSTLQNDVTNHAFSFIWNQEPERILSSSNCTVPSQG